MRRIWIGAALAALPALGAGGSLAISDTLNAYQLYGKDFVKVDGDAETSQDGGVGSDALVDLTNNNVKINGDLTSGGNVRTKSNIDVAGMLNARGDVAFLDDNSSVAKRTNVGGKLSLTGGNPMNNVFADSLWIGSSPVAVAAGWAINTFAGVAVKGPVSPANRPPGLRFGANRPFPSSDLRLPDTSVSFDPARNCTTLPGVTLDLSMCGLGGNPGDTLLPPGRYGDWVIASGNKVYLTSGLYQFRSLNILSDGTRFLFVQPGNAPTRVLIQGDLTVGPGDNLVAPARYVDPAFKAGTVLLYVNGNVRLSDDNKIWATVAAPHTDVIVRTGLRLYGQIFGKSISVQNGFKGGVGSGRYIPMGKPPRFKYSVIHYEYKE